jgi:predicted GNAT family N-acyltransferase
MTSIGKAMQTTSKATAPDPAQERERPIRFGVATTLEERARVYELRESVYRDLDWNHLLFEHQQYVAHDQLDEHAYIFYLETQGGVFATCRVTQLHWHEAFLDAISRFKPDLDVDTSVVIERLTLRADCRNGTNYTRLLATVCHYIETNTQNLHWYAKCNPALTRMYRRFGAAVIGREAQPSSGGSGRTYQYLQGVIRETRARVISHIIPY